MIGQSPTCIANNRGFSDLPSCRDGLALLNQIARQSRKGIKVEKQRQGRTGKLTLRFNGDLMKFEESGESVEEDGEDDNPFV